MGRRRKRKQERQREQRSSSWESERDAYPVAPPMVVSRQTAPGASDYFLGVNLAIDDFAPRVEVNACGSCREFIEDQHGGRGECLHPGSGILSPWTDTPGCPFFARIRR
ncbi:MAG: hypothetical protein ACSLFM_11965 [Tepidiformaceae bacterium]